ncbi:hypothetical protein D3C78_1412140 [compost metagenome]
MAYGLTGKEHPFQVHRHGAIPSVFGQFFRRIQRDNPGAIDQHIQPPEMGIGLRNRLFYRGFVGNVHHDAQRLLLIQLLGNLHHLCSAIQQHDLCTVLQIAFGNSQTYSRRAAGYQRHFPLQGTLALTSNHRKLPQTVSYAKL